MDKPIGEIKDPSSQPGDQPTSEIMNPLSQLGDQPFSEIKILQYFAEIKESASVRIFSCNSILEDTPAQDESFHSIHLLNQCHHSISL
jgi:hypothetical protein